MQDETSAILANFKAYTKEFAAKTLVLQNARNYSELESYVNIKHSWEGDSLSQFEKTLNHFIKITQINLWKSIGSKKTFKGTWKHP